jgi:uncharacterized SAM-binding protein YcdF (DUF218 family)
VVGRLLRLVLLACALAAGGFLAFLAARPAVPESPPRADGAAVLTGGAGRIDAGLALLATGRVRMLLISGVHPDVTLADLARESGAGLPAGGRIALGRAARSTRGNAREVAAWAEQNGLSSVILVTSRLHMRRAILELRRAAPGLAVVAFPVADPDGALMLRRAVPEYMKLVGALLGAGALVPPREALP